MEPSVIHEEKDFLAVLKPAGMLVHAVGPNGSDKGTLVEWALRRYPEIASAESSGRGEGFHRPGIVHRLDRDTSGIMLVARTKEYLQYLQSLFAERHVRKTYLALVFGVPSSPSGSIDEPIGISRKGGKRSVHSSLASRPAHTEYRVLQEGTERNCSLLEVVPKTGRTHQIRVHLASMGHPVLGDELYGSGDSKELSGSLSANRLMLHANSLGFEASPGNAIMLEAPPDQGFLSILARAGISRLSTHQSLR